MNVLILGSGGREHAFAWKIAQSNLLSKLYIAPGNAGTGLVGTNLDVPATNFEGIKKLVLQHQINLVVVGPEDPLVKGIHDFFRNDEELKSIPVIGPDQKGAQLEGSKEFAKEFMVKYRIPTAAYGSFTLETYGKACAFLDKMKSPYVLKADGLAAGKGVLIIHNISEAKEALKSLLEGQFGSASTKVVIEEFLSGIEVSFFVLTDGENYVLLPEAKDYKRIGANDTGLNTGGMGAVSPVPFATNEFTQKVVQRIIGPTIHGLKAEGIHYQGFIFFGLIKVGNEPFVIEYNARMGDPETEVVLPRIESDFLELLAAVPEKKLSEVPFSITNKAATTVMMVSGGYPGDYQKGKVITGFESVTDSLVFHAGTSVNNNQIVTNGGRVLAVTSLAGTKEDALQCSYKNAAKLSFDQSYYRPDIGFDL
ncbi:MAG TPA: phosphoribosylamine--glycine ligase [Marinilabiliales bacterium]|nr:phosphoribosylamine--glycine ligase [Marinilabiliales bacterium]